MASAGIAGNDLHGGDFNLVARILAAPVRPDIKEHSFFDLTLAALQTRRRNAMNTYLLLKWAHILSSVLLVGTGFGSAFYLYFIHRTRNLHAIAEVSRLVVRADFWFTTPAIIVQPLTGYAMMSMSSYSFSQTWLLWTVGLYLLAGLCWLPVVWLQLRMADMAEYAVETDTALPNGYWQYARYWEWLGYPAFIAMLGVYWLMVFKPV
jgi:uncharacterized membrane protein